MGFRAAGLKPQSTAFVRDVLGAHVCVYTFDMCMDIYTRKIPWPVRKLSRTPLDKPRRTATLQKLQWTLAHTLGA